MERTKHSRFILLALYLCVVVNSQECTVKEALRAGDIFQKSFEATYDLIRRGFSDDIASYHLRIALFDLMFYAEITKLVDTPLSEICVPQHIYGQTFSVRWTTVSTEKSLDDMLLSISDVFYNSKNASLPLPTPEAYQINDKMRHWKIIEDELRKVSGKVNPWTFKFPQTVIHFLDKKNEAACAEWRKHSYFETKTSADKGLHNLLKMVVNLISAGCDENKAWQLIRHYTALVHLGIRCERKEGSNLKVPDTFMASYNEAAILIMEDARMLGKLRELKHMDNYAFELINRFVVNRLTTFGSWGGADMIFDASIVVKNAMGFTSHSVHKKMKKLDLLVRTYGNTIPVAVWKNNVPDCKTNNNNYRDKKCLIPKYCYYNSTNEPVNIHTFEKKCCDKLLCTNAVTTVLGGTSFRECCKERNQATDSKRKKMGMPKNNGALIVPQNESDEYRTVHVYLL